eukprot:CAMPEP_0198287052 /NCGR_PEP_ID=MMETSP1449-20131203/5986_1 /TAXON_ID=420275 /ORGANISM="Attheya septentrionalis, Strain CCMP2084" /LENGTH=515 /DNA_ID=CAMNT_0043984947 /DNA_START=150 /DNA_END=1697 /DNA_ORIENTATION=+
MREIPSLVSLCLRSVGPKGCDSEVTFGGIERKTRSNSNVGAIEEKKKEESSGSHGVVATATATTMTSRLLRSYHTRPVGPVLQTGLDGNASLSMNPEHVPLERVPYISPQNPKRHHANDVDMNHPWVAIQGGLIESGTPASDLLQNYIDALVELGRMDDEHLGIHFFTEWAHSICGQKDSNTKFTAEPLETSTPLSKKRRRSGKPVLNLGGGGEERGMPRRGALSLHNSASTGPNTFGALQQSGAGRHISVLDLTGVHSLTDSLLAPLLNHCPHLTRLSLKNCRKVQLASTDVQEAMVSRLPHLFALDVGGCFNVTPQTMLSLVQQKHQLNSGSKQTKLSKSNQKNQWTELHVSGLGWDDVTLLKLMEWIGSYVQGLSLAFSVRVSPSAWEIALDQCHALKRLNIAFCDQVTSSTLSILRHENLHVLDIRGCHQVSSLSPLYESRHGSLSDVSLGITGEQQKSLLVLARYSCVTRSSIEDTRRLFPLTASIEQLNIILDGGGLGMGIIHTPQTRP